MGQPDIKEIEAGLKDWDFVRNLPAAIGEYTLVPGSGINGQILNIAAYVHEASHCRLDLTYTKETFDYVPVKTVGLHTFRDVRFFCRDREHFADMMRKSLPDILASMDKKTVHKLPYEAKALHFEQWDYWRTLPAQVGDYELYITPLHTALSAAVSSHPNRYRLPAFPEEMYPDNPLPSLTVTS